ncbi:hypothetical protein [Rhizobium leguminosarum]|uniref:Uncharacterized protein n=1 Tax=Rhizobium leguminosarum TaxID=384 RepID=A0A2Z4YEU1_RHILE|nr:hypothetical protein [Rhizobium leguminosarum]AXA39824.1 hypothetical protein DLJ82_2231 [Rhizobium leguminosarum]
MNRHRWYKTEWGLPLSEIKNGLASRRFLPGGLDGFMLEQTREDRIFGSYIERLTTIETVVDPFGQQASFERTEYRKSEFVISRAGRFGLELINPNRSASRLISKFLEASNYQFVLTSMYIDPIKWANKCADLLNRRFKIESLTAGEIAIGGGISGELSLKGQGDILLAAQSALDGKTYQVEKIQLQFEGIPGGVVLTSSGTLVARSQSANLVIDCAREAINLSQSN